MKRQRHEFERDGVRVVVTNVPYEWLDDANDWGATPEVLRQVERMIERAIQPGVVFVELDFALIERQDAA
ncbi:MAG: hypothetical protein O3A46_15700 [Candidatus Poribacteria bacterium]|nr:hypothetical protein [Candidatus Poribacteria bacterium]